MAEDGEEFGVFSFGRGVKAVLLVRQREQHPLFSRLVKMYKHLY